MRAEILDTTILGLLAEGPTHGYDLKRRLTGILGPLRALSFGSLYPALKRLEHRGDIARELLPATTRRSKVNYIITEQGEKRLQIWLQGNTPADWDDDGFAVRLALFSQTESRIRLRILQGRRTRLEERLAALDAVWSGSIQAVHNYVHQLHQHSLESTQREMYWIDELIRTENQKSTKQRVRSVRE
jgi:DNA-binding PadR family transcriptional regulator